MKCVKYSSSGDAIIFQIERKETIAEALFIYDAPQKRKPFLDQLFEGLVEFKLGAAICNFPQLFEPLFVNTRKLEPKHVVQILNTVPVKLNEYQQLVYGYLTQF